jgi:hypothetical protein
MICGCFEAHVRDTAAVIVYAYKRLWRYVDNIALVTAQYNISTVCANVSSYYGVCMCDAGEQSSDRSASQVQPGAATSYCGGVQESGAQGTVCTALLL